jgi:hypothetical protein
MTTASFANSNMTDKTTGTTPIPGPPGLPLVGNAFAIDTELPLRTFQNFADEYGKLANSGKDSEWY